MSRDIWKDMNNQRRFMDWIGKELNVQNYQDWYKVKTSDILNRGGYSLLTNFYEGSLRKAILTIYPNENWDAWR